ELFSAISSATILGTFDGLVGDKNYISGLTDERTPFGKLSFWQQGIVSGISAGTSTLIKQFAINELGIQDSLFATAIGNVGALPIQSYTAGIFHGFNKDLPVDVNKFGLTFMGNQLGLMMPEIVSTIASNGVSELITRYPEWFGLDAEDVAAGYNNIYTGISGGIANSSTGRYFQFEDIMNGAMYGGLKVVASQIATSIGEHNPTFTDLDNMLIVNVTTAFITPTAASLLGFPSGDSPTKRIESDGLNVVSLGNTSRSGSPLSELSYFSTLQDTFGPKTDAWLENQHNEISRTGLTTDNGSNVTVTLRNGDTVDLTLDKGTAADFKKAGLSPTDSVYTDSAGNQWAKNSSGSYVLLDAANDATLSYPTTPVGALTLVSAGNPMKDLTYTDSDGNQWASRGDGTYYKVTDWADAELGRNFWSNWGNLAKEIYRSGAARNMSTLTTPVVTGLSKYVVSPVMDYTITPAQRYLSNTLLGSPLFSHYFADRNKDNWMLPTIPSNIMEDPKLLLNPAGMSWEEAWFYSATDETTPLPGESVRVTDNNIFTRLLGINDISIYKNSWGLPVGRGENDSTTIAGYKGSDFVTEYNRQISGTFGKPIWGVNFSQWNYHTGEGSNVHSTVYSHIDSSYSQKYGLVINKLRVVPVEVNGVKSIRFIDNYMNAQGQAVRGMPTSEANIIQPETMSYDYYKGPGNTVLGDRAQLTAIVDPQKLSVYTMQPLSGTEIYSNGLKDKKLGTALASMVVFKDLNGNIDKDGLAYHSNQDGINNTLYNNGEEINISLDKQVKNSGTGSQDPSVAIKTHFSVSEVKGNTVGVFNMMDNTDFIRIGNSGAELRIGDIVYGDGSESVSKVGANQATRNDRWSVNGVEYVLAIGKDGNISPIQATQNYYGEIVHQTEGAGSLAFNAQDGNTYAQHGVFVGKQSDATIKWSDSNITNIAGDFVLGQLVGDGTGTRNIFTAKTKFSPEGFERTIAIYGVSKYGDALGIGSIVGPIREAKWNDRKSGNENNANFQGGTRPPIVTTQGGIQTDSQNNVNYYNGLFNFGEGSTSDLVFGPGARWDGYLGEYSYQALNNVDGAVTSAGMGAVLPDPDTTFGFISNKAAANGALAVKLEGSSQDQFTPVFVDTSSEKNALTFLGLNPTNGSAALQQTMSKLGGMKLTTNLNGTADRVVDAVSNNEDPGNLAVANYPNQLPLNASVTTVDYGQEDRLFTQTAAWQSQQKDAPASIGKLNSTVVLDNEAPLQYGDNTYNLSVNRSFSVGQTLGGSADSITGSVGNFTQTHSEQAGRFVLSESYDFMTGEALKPYVQTAGFNTTETTFVNRYNEVAPRVLGADNKPKSRLGEVAHVAFLDPANYQDRISPLAGLVSRDIYDVLQDVG
ncbi:MAG: hypothetical protein NT033_06840, partial [Candidatus Omnitrophica bacterium]|nr:hypothetical protein [Candidatus Omnitrophota bacterium]